MIHRHVRNVRAVGVRLIVPGAFVVATWCGGVSPAAASIIADHHANDGHIVLNTGNGRLNKNYSTVLSPTVNRGLQQVSNTNISGKTTTQVAFCKKRNRICHISQRIWLPDW
jgi:hypothetical protein